MYQKSACVGVKWTLNLLSRAPESLSNSCLIESPAQSFGFRLLDWSPFFVQQGSGGAGGAGGAGPALLTANKKGFNKSRIDGNFS